MNYYPNQPLSRAFNVAVEQIAGRILPKGFDVHPAAPASLDDLAGHYHHTGRVCVWDGASNHTIFDDAEINYMFRAWHDATHIKLGAEFDPAGEYAVYKAQVEDVRALYGKAASRFFVKILHAEVLGQLRYRQLHDGEFPFDQLAFVVAWLDRGTRAAHFDFSEDRDLDEPNWSFGYWHNVAQYVLEYPSEFSGADLLQARNTMVRSLAGIRKPPR